MLRCIISERQGPPDCDNLSCNESALAMVEPALASPISLLLHFSSLMEFPLYMTIELFSCKVPQDALLSILFHCACKSPLEVLKIGLRLLEPSDLR